MRFITLCKKLQNNALHNCRNFYTHIYYHHLPLILSSNFSPRFPRATVGSLFLSMLVSGLLLFLDFQLSTCCLTIRTYFHIVKQSFYQLQIFSSFPSISVVAKIVQLILCLVKVKFANKCLNINVYIIIRKLNLVKKQNSYFAESNLNKEM